MAKNNKSHAKDYLLEYKAKREIPNWLRLLIRKALDTNGAISDEDKEQIFEALLKENGFESAKEYPTPSTNENVAPQEETEAPSVNQRLILQKITHKKGVNALIPGQAISFSPACTIIYGLTGTGKSGYFRIIHELAGGDETKTILGNIHKQEDALEIDIAFLLDDKPQSPYKWQDKSIRGITPFDQIEVFDSEYSPTFLNERESSVNIEPLGLNLFQIITIIIDDFKAKLEERKQQEEQQKSDLHSLFDLIHSEQLKLLLQKETLSEEESRLLENNKTFSVIEAAKLSDLKKQKQNIEKKNTEDSKTILSQAKTEIDNLNRYLSNLKTNLETLTKDISQAIADYLVKKKTRDKRAKEFEVLKNIPYQHTEEWQIFIESAKEYERKVDQHAFSKDKNCIYCHQPLDDEALKLIRAYSQYLSDQSQQNVKNAGEKIEELKTRLSQIAIDFSFSESLKTILAGITNTQGQRLQVLVNQILEEGKKQKTDLEEVLQGKAPVASKVSLDLLKIDEKLQELADQKHKALGDLQQSESDRKQKIADFEIEINTLEDKHNISKWKTKIEQYFSCCETAHKYSAVNQTISTRGITDLGSKAHDELLTDSIRQSFEDELKALGEDIEVHLEKASAGKGTVRTRLKILGNDVCDILSDGEQKVVSLALFLAEIESKNIGCPIAFDDPVTSVDHEVADYLAKRLLQISQNRQIIIFTHNKLFYDSLFFWGNNLKDDNNNTTHHVCKNYIQSGCNGKGCHVLTYRVDREAKDKTGRIFEAQNESCNYFVKEAENEMRGEYSLSCVAGYLKSAIEHYIDEKVLNKQGLMKDRKRKENIRWDELKKINIDKDKIDRLKLYWDKLSDRASHSTQSSSENPLKTEDLNEIITFLKQ